MTLLNSHLQFLFFFTLFVVRGAGGSFTVVLFEVNGSNEINDQGNRAIE